MGVRWYVAYPWSTRHIEELMLERGVHVDHSTINERLTAVCLAGRLGWPLYARDVFTPKTVCAGDGC